MFSNVIPHFVLNGSLLTGNLNKHLLGTSTNYQVFYVIYFCLAFSCDCRTIYIAVYKQGCVFVLTKGGVDNWL